MSETTLEIANWDKWQTYRSDRNTPPWIKVHRNLFSNQEWSSLSDSERGQLVCMWILAADKSGTIPADPRVIQKMCQLDKAPDVPKFVGLGFLASTGCQPDVTVTHQTRLDKTRLDKSKENSRFAPPTQDEVHKYMTEKGLDAISEAEKFVDFYESKGWLVGKAKMKSWKAAARNWLKRNTEDSKKPQAFAKMSDQQLVTEANKLNIRTQGKDKFQLIEALVAKKRMS